MSNEEGHLKFLEEVLERLAKAGLSKETQMQFHSIQRSFISWP